MFKPLNIVAWTVLCGVFTNHLYSKSSDILDCSALSVKVDSSIPVLVKKQLLTRADGFTRLEISLTNEGSVPLIIKSIEIDIPFVEPVSATTEGVYGSSCMYEMLQLAEDDYLFIGSLSWRTFLPVFTASKEGCPQ